MESGCTALCERLESEPFSKKINPPSVSWEITL